MSQYVETVLWGLIVYLAVFLVNYLWIFKRGYNNIVKQKKKKKNKKLEDFIGFSYLVPKFNLDINKMNLNYVFFLVSLVNAFIISFVFIIVYIIPWNIGFSMLLGFVIFMIIIIIYIIIVTTNKKKEIPKNNAMPVVNNPQAIEEIKKHIPDFDVNKFLSTGYNIYLNIENAWMNFELDKVRDVMTDEMFNMYESQLTSMEMKGEQNIMKDFRLLNSAITNASLQNNMMQVTTRYVIEFYDYIINKDTKQVVRGNSNRKIRMVYEMTFIEKLEKAKLDKCPNCGAPINMNSTGICEYCNSKIVAENTEWVMSKKVSLRQENL